MDYNLLKSLHILFVVTWFAGLFYIVRLFIYHTETQEMQEPERSILQKQYTKMEYLLWNVITQPSMFLTIFVGPSLAWVMGIFQTSEALKANPWMHAKLFFVALLLAYHFSCHLIFKQLQRGEIRYKSGQLRMWNEVATLLLVAIVFIVVYKNSLDAAKALGGFFAFAVILFLLIKLAKNIRQKSQG